MSPKDEDMNYFEQYSLLYSEDDTKKTVGHF